MNINTKEKIQHIQAEDLNRINGYISKIEVILLDKFDRDQTNNILKFEREQIFEDIELAEIISGEFNIPSIIKKRETRFYTELRDLEENQVLSFLNLDFISRFFKNMRQSSPVLTDEMGPLPSNSTELFTAYLLLLPVVFLAIVPGVYINILIFSQFIFVAIFSIYINFIKSPMKQDLFTLYAVSWMAMLTTASIQISGVLGNALDNGSNLEEASASYALIYSSILFFGLIWKRNSFESILSNNNKISNGKYYLLKIIYVSIITTIIATINGIYLFGRAGLSLETNNIYPFVEFVVLVGIIFSIRNMFINTEPSEYPLELHSTTQAIKHEKLTSQQSISQEKSSTISKNSSNINSHGDREKSDPQIKKTNFNQEFTVSSNLKNKMVKVTIDKKKYKEFSTLRLFSKKKILVLLISVSLIALGTYLYEISTSYYNSFPNITEGYININHDLAINLSYLLGIALLSLYLMVIIIQIIVRLGRGGSKGVIYNLSVRGNIIMYEDLYRPSSGMTSSKYLAWLGELTYRDIILIELEE